jgi:hypothetical protein
MSRLSRICPKFTVRRLMVAVAIVAVAFGYQNAVRRRHLFEFEAFLHRQEMEDCRGYLAGATALSTEGDGKRTYRRAVPTGPDPFIADARSRGWGVELLERASLKRLEAYHAAMTAKYEHAARYPWLPVAPDPPEPED